MKIARALFLVALVALPACKKDPTVGDYVREHRAVIEAYVANVEDAKAHLASAPREMGSEQILTAEEQKAFDEGADVYAREALEQPGGKKPVWSGSLAGFKEMLEGKVSDAENSAPGAVEATARLFDRVAKTRFIIVAETLPNDYPVGWHGLGMLWDVQKHTWRAAANVQWSPVSRTAVSATQDRLDSHDEAEIRRAIVEAVRFRAVNPMLPRPPDPKKKK